MEIGKTENNVKKSTEAELVEVSNYLPYNIWAIMFMEGQGYLGEKNAISGQSERNVDGKEQ